MEWYWIVLIAVGGVALFYLLVSFVIAKKVLQMATTPVAHTLDEARAYQSEKEGVSYDDYDHVWKKEKFSVAGVHGKIVGEIVYNGEGASAKRPKVAVICHGHTWNRLNSLKYANIFYAKGYNLVLYDHAYFGESEGQFTTLGLYEKQDLNAVLNLVREKFGKNAIVGLHGESMGAATVLLELGVRNDVDFVVADCPFSYTMSYYRELCTHLTHLPSFPIVDMANAMSKRKFGYDFTKVSPLDAVKNSNTPVCFIHGKEDKFIYPSHSEKMFAVCKNPLSELHLVDGAAHACSHLVNNEQYWQIVGDFVDKVENSLAVAE